MAILYITEYAKLGESSVGGAQVPEEPPVAEQTVVIGAGSLQSAVFNPKTRILRIHPDVICSIAIGINPAASNTNTGATATGNQRMSAGVTEFKALNLQGNPPPAYRIAVITNT